MPETAAPTDRANTPLLTLITQQSLDEDYQHVAERRAAENGGAPPPRRRPTRTAGIVVAVFGLLVTVAAVQTSEQEGVAGRQPGLADRPDRGQPRRRRPPPAADRPDA